MKHTMTASQANVADALTEERDAEESMGLYRLQTLDDHPEMLEPGLYHAWGPKALFSPTIELFDSVKRGELARALRRRTEYPSADEGLAEFMLSDWSIRLQSLDWSVEGVAQNGDHLILRRSRQAPNDRLAVVVGRGGGVALGRFGDEGDDREFNTEPGLGRVVPAEEVTVAALVVGVVHC